MGRLIDQYRAGRDAVPETMLAWELYDTGLANFGRFGRPVRIPTPTFGPDELLARIDAAGLCFSDIKILSQGSEHARLRGRNLRENPVIMGHEVALTIVGVGKDLTAQYQPGDRFVVQADIYYKGVGLAFGYQLPGALCQYVKLGKEVLAGDHGCYLIPIHNAGYAEAALAEPWACVEAAFRFRPRSHLVPDGTTLILGAGGCELGESMTSGGCPAKVVLAGVADAVAQAVRAQCPGAEVVVADGTIPSALADAHTGGTGFDDIILLGVTEAAVVEDAAKRLAKGGVLALLGTDPVSAEVEVDVGRIHYEATQYVGTTTPCVADAYGGNPRVDLVEGGRTWVVGAGGPMGQMHVQRALELRAAPRVVVASDIDAARLGTIPERYGDTAQERGIELICLNPKDLGPDVFDAELRRIAPEGFDDVLVLAPAAALVSASAPYLRRDGVMNIFAGLPRGTMARLDLSGVHRRNVRFIGTSGSAIEDLEFTLRKSESGELSPNRSVAAIGGLNAAWEGLKGVKEGRFAGKVVIFPQIPDLALTPLEALHRPLPGVAEALNPRGEWTREAEERLIERDLAETPVGRRLEGRSAIVTGGAQGLGRALAERLALEGARVLITDINDEGVQDAAAAIAAATLGPVVGVRADCTSEEDMEAAVGCAVSEWGHLDILVSNAGILISGEITEFEVAQWRRVIDVNLVGYFVAAKAAATAMIPQGRGAIVQINSKSGKKGSFRNSAYAASKFGGIGLTQSLALELAPHQIRVNSVCPGNLLDSPLWTDSLYEQYAQRWGLTVGEVRRKYAEQVPLGRGTDYTDVANLVVFLLSDDSSYMTGQAINVTGGQEMR